MKEKATPKIVVVADAHVQDGTDSEREFDEMLALLASGGHDVCFLGDVMELWMGLARFETPAQVRFRDWCKAQRERRKVTFLEGNHEFFVIRLHDDCFSESAEGVLRLPSGDCLLHGDQVQCDSLVNALFRWALNSGFMYWTLRLLPFAPSIVRLAKRALEFKNRNRKPYFPAARICSWAENEFRQGAHRVFMGHFHRCRRKTYRSGDSWQVLPDWKSTGRVLLYDPDRHSASIIPWRRIPMTNFTPPRKPRKTPEK